jgi:hypothetical protein
MLPHWLGRIASSLPRAIDTAIWTPFFRIMRVEFSKSFQNPKVVQTDSRRLHIDVSMRNKPRDLG